MTNEDYSHMILRNRKSLGIGPDAMEGAVKKTVALFTRKAPEGFDGTKWSYRTDKFDVEVMAVVGRFATVRRLGAMPFVANVEELSYPEKGLPMTDIKRLTELIDITDENLREIRAILCAVRADMEDRATR